MAADLWAAIHRLIRAGRHPRKSDIDEALRSSRIPNDEIQRYLFARLIGENKPPSGRHTKPWLQDHFEKNYHVRRVDRWSRVFKNRYKRRNFKQEAFRKVQAEYGSSWGNDETAETLYKRAKANRLLIGNPDWWIARVMRHNQWGPFKKPGEKSRNPIDLDLLRFGAPVTMRVTGTRITSSTGPWRLSKPPATRGGTKNRFRLMFPRG